MKRTWLALLGLQGVNLFAYSIYSTLDGGITFLRIDVGRWQLTIPSGGFPQNNTFFFFPQIIEGFELTAQWADDGTINLQCKTLAGEYSDGGGNLVYLPFEIVTMEPQV